VIDQPRRPGYPADVQWAIGSLAAAVALQIVSELPVDRWRNAVYSMWAFIGFAAIVLCFIPESPRFYCARGNHERGKKTLQWINGGVSGYDVDHEYAIIEKEIQDGRVVADQAKRITVLDCFKGKNLVSGLERGLNDWLISS
jgi:hypothetical protein